MSFRSSSSSHGRKEPEAAAEYPDDDESRAAAVLDALFNDTSSESDCEGFAPAEVEASMMPAGGARVDSSEDEIGENNEGKGEPATDESDSDIDQAPADDGLDADGGVKSKKYRGGGRGIRTHLLSIIIIIY